MSNHLTAADALVVAFLIVWFLCCLAAQCSERARNRLYRLDWFHLIPNWRLFAPRPLRRDPLFFRRFQLRHGPRTAWEAVDEGVARPRFASLWYPQARIKKMLIDLTRCFMASRSVAEDFYGMSSPFYIALLWYFSNQHIPADAVAIQFCIVSHREYDEACEPSVIFCSP